MNQEQPPSPTPAGKAPRESAAVRKGHPVMTFEELVNQICAERGWRYRHLGNTVVMIEVVPEKGRKQEVCVETFSEDGELLVRVRTRIGPAADLSPHQIQSVLRMNARMRYGAFGVQGEDLCLVDSYLFRDADPDELAESVEFLAKRGDYCEKHVYAKDEH